MNIKFDNNVKEALVNLLNSSSNDYIRIKVAFGCGKPYYEVRTDMKIADDVEEEIQGIRFVAQPRDAKACNGIEILYDPKVYIKGFYIKEI